MDLEALRAKIDLLDQQLVDLLNQRAQVVVEVGKLKQHNESQIYAPDREKQVFAKICAANRGPLPNSCLEAIWRDLMSGSLALEKPLKIAYLGPEGSFSHLAASRKFGVCVSYVPQLDIRSVFDEVVRGSADYGIVPIENSTDGAITETLDAFLQSPLKICAEIQVSIHHNLLGCGSLEKIEKVYSKPEVFGQCRKWLSDNLRRVELIPTPSSSAAVEKAAGDESAAAVGSILAAELYGVPVLAANIEDKADNVTRFFVIGTEAAKATGDDKTAIVLTVAHSKGTLADVLDIFRDHAINLTDINKRPGTSQNWEYCFFLDCQGHAGDASLAAALKQVEDSCQQLHVIGSFPRASTIL